MRRMRIAIAIGVALLVSATGSAALYPPSRFALRRVRPAGRAAG